MIQTFLTDRRIILGTSFSEYLGMTATLLTSLKVIQGAVAKLSPAERTQIEAFTRANTEPPRKGTGKWFLAVIRNANGRKFMTAGYSIEKAAEGVSPGDFRKALGIGEPPAPKPLPKATAVKGTSLLGRKKC